MQEEISQVKRKELTLEQCICCLEKVMFQLYAAAETKEDFTILAKAKSFKEIIDKKKELIVYLDTAINKQEDECKSM